MCDGMKGVGGVGVDLCAISRMEPLLKDHRFLDRYFTSGEIAYIRQKGVVAAPTMAGIFAAKEAALKAMGVGLALPMRSLEVTHTPAGVPVLTVHEPPFPCRFHLSISHEGDMAVAFVVMTSGEDRVLTEGEGST